MGEVNVDDFFCPNEACPDYGKKGKGNIRLKEYYGKQNTALIRCRTCKKTFSENRGTPFFGLHTPKKTVLRSMAMLVEKGSIRGTAGAMGADKDSVALWLKRAGEHCEEVMDYLLRNLNLSQVQNTFWLLKKRKQSLLPVIMSAGVPLKTRLNCSQIWKPGEIRAQSFRFLPVTTGTHISR